MEIIMRPLCWTLSLLMLALLISISFRLICSPATRLNLTPQAKRKITTLHAFAIEGIQLALLAISSLDIFFLTFATNWAHPGTFICLVLKVLVRSFFSAAAVAAVDAIEHITILEDWSRSSHRKGVEVQTFVLTREMLIPALKRWWAVLRGKGGRVLDEGRLVVYAKKVRQNGVEEVVLRRMMVTCRRRSESCTPSLTDAAQDYWRQEEIGLVEALSSSSMGRVRMRRQSFLDELLNTRLLLIDSRITSSVQPTSNHQDISTMTSSAKVSNDRLPAKDRKEKGRVWVSRDGSPGRRSRGGNRVWEIEGAKGRDSEDSGAGAERMVGKARWRHPGSNWREDRRKGAVLSCILLPLCIAYEIAYDITEFLVAGVFGAIWVLFLLIFFAKRDGLDVSDIGENMFLQVQSRSANDARFMFEHNATLVSWNKAAGVMQVNWDGAPMEEPNTLYSFYPRCTGFQNGKVVDDEGHTFPLDYWTPNGTADLLLPEGGWTKAQWLMEINEDDVWDCRDRYYELPLMVPRPKPKELSQEQENFIQRQRDLKAAQNCDMDAIARLWDGDMKIKTSDPLFKLTVYCKDTQRGHARRSNSVANHFSALPSTTDAVAKYTADGADVIMQAFNAKNVTGRQQARILAKAMSSIMDAHHKQKRSLMRFFKRGEAAQAHEVMDQTVSAVIDAAELDHKVWMQMLAIGGMARAIRESAFSEKSDGKVEFAAMRKMFDRMA